MIHPINSKIGTGACRAVESVDKANLYPNVIWMSEEENKAQSTVVSIQTSSEKSQTSLSLLAHKHFIRSV